MALSVAKKAYIADPTPIMKAVPSDQPVTLANRMKITDPGCLVLLVASTTTKKTKNPSRLAEKNAISPLGIALGS